MHRIRAVTTTSIHRAVERHAALCGDATALVEGERVLTYRELNCAANAVARGLMAHGLRRGTHVVVRMPRGIDLAVVLLAVLKAGGCYTWQDADDGTCAQPGVSFTPPGCGNEARPIHVAAVDVVPARITPSPNLPIMTRGTDTACVLEGASRLLVPHATIVSLKGHDVRPQTAWAGDPGAFDLWIPLMAGATAVVRDQPAAVAA